MTLLGRTGEYWREIEGESEQDGCSQNGTAEEKMIPHPGKSPTAGKIKRTGGISDVEKRIEVSWSTEKQIKNPTDDVTQSP